MTRILGVPDSWEIATLEEVTDPIRTISYGILKPGPDVPDGVPYVRVVNMRGNKILIDDLRRTSHVIAKQYARTSLLPEDVLLSIRGTYGRTAIVPSQLDGANITQDTARLAFMEGIDPRFASLYLQSPSAQSYFERVARGVAVKGVNIRDLRTAPFPVPPRAEQHRIVATLEDHLSRLDKALQYLSRARTNIGILASAVREAEVGGSPGRTLPNGWRWGSIRDVIVDIEAGKSFACESRPARDDEWGVVKVSSMTWGEFRESENKAVPPGRFVDPRYEIRPGDILISRANTPAYVGASVLVHKCRPRLMLSDKSLRLRLRPDVDRDWLIHALSAPSTRLRITARATGTKDSMRNISQQSLLNVGLPIPPEPEQAILGARVRARLESIEQARHELNSRETLYEVFRHSILTAAFTGQLVAQDPNDEPAARLMTRIREHRAAKGDSRRTRRANTRSVKENRHEQETLL